MMILERTVDIETSKFLNFMMLLTFIYRVRMKQNKKVITELLCEILLDSI